MRYTIFNTPVLKSFLLGCIPVSIKNTRLEEKG